MFGDSGFQGTLCGGGWASTGNSGARLGCCPAGSYMVAPETDPFVVEDSCTKCPVGQFGSNDGNDDTSCPGTCSAGKSSSEGDISCEDCTAGKYSTTAGSACENCIAGKASSQGKTLESDCTACEVGMYSSSGSACTNCPKGYGIIGMDVTQCFVCSFSKVRLFFLNVHLLETSLHSLTVLVLPLY